MRLRLPAGRARPSGDRGMVTAEIAVVMPAVVMVLGAVLFTGSAVTTQVRCQDAARAGARLAARGESGSSVVSEAARIAPPGARITLSSNASDAVVTVSAAARAPVAGWVVLSLSATATAQIESDLDADSALAQAPP